jgi:SAM-dependent methyltransferase
VDVPNGPCPFCGEAAGWDPYRIREMMFGTREPFDYGRCRACGSLTIARVPDDLGRHYPDAYYANTPRATIEADSLVRRIATREVVRQELFGGHPRRAAIARRFGGEVPRQLAEVRTLIRDGGLRSFDDPILDVGSGATPARLAILAKVGFRRLLGIEPFIPRDLSYHGVRIQKGYLDDVGGGWALVMFHHSLEHVPDPLATLSAARARLRADGRCLIRIPVADGVMWRRFGVDWAELDAPRHLVLPSRAGVDALARRAGFEVIRTTWESGDWELIASEQYQHDVGMFEPASLFADPPGRELERDQAVEYKQDARQMNANGDAGRAAFWLRPIAGPATD